MREKVYRNCFLTQGVSTEFLVPATLIKKERPFSLEVFRHTGHSGHLLIAAYCRFAPETQKRPKSFPAVWFRGDFGRFLSI